MKKQSRKKLAKPRPPDIRMVAVDAGLPFRWSKFFALVMVVVLALGIQRKVMAEDPSKQAVIIAELKTALIKVCKERDDAKATLSACEHKSAHRTVVNARKHSALSQVQADGTTRTAKVPCP